MQRVLVAAVFIFLGCAACRTVEKAPTDARVAEAQRAFDEGLRLQEELRHAEAVLLFQRALELREAAFGPHHPEVAAAIHGLADNYSLQGDYGRAVKLYEHALSLREASLGKEHPDVAQSLNDLANRYMYEGNYERAEALHARALAIRVRDAVHAGVTAAVLERRST